MRRRYVATTDSDHDHPIFRNLAKDKIVNGANQLWVADITYVAVASGFVYVAVILATWSRRVVGYVISRTIDVRLTLAALNAAIEDRKPRPAAFITRIAARNMPRKPIGRPSTAMASSARWAGVAIPTITPKRRAS
jgi:transposase InsO family protein